MTTPVLIDSTGLPAPDDVLLPLVSVIICAYTEDRWVELGEAIGSATGQQPPPVQVIVVIDHNPALLARAAIAYPDAVVTPNQYERGLSGARNTGVAAAIGDLVAFLDDDARARPGWLRSLSKVFDDPKVLSVGGGVTPRWAAARPQWLPRSFWWVVGCSYEGLPERGGLVRNPIGANMAFRRSLLNVAGGFTSGLGRVGRTPLGCEETELCIRLSQRHPDGVHVYAPAAVVDHLVPAGRGRWNYFVHRCYAEGLSKAKVSALVGQTDGLSSERAHVLRTLPRAAKRCVLRGPDERDPAAVAEVGAMAAGLAAVGAGFMVGSLLLRAQEKGGPMGAAGTKPLCGPAPACIVEHDLARPLRCIPVATPDGRPYRRAVVLARAGGHPLGLVSFDLARGIDAAGIGAAVEAQFGDRMAALEASAPETSADAINRMGVSMPVSVIVATRNRPQHLDRCLGSLRRSDHSDFEVIVVDNGPSRDTESVVRAHYQRGLEVRYVVERVRGASRARNAGLRLVETSVVAVTDDDVTTDAGWLRALTGRFSQGDDISCVTGLVLPETLDTDAEVQFETWGGFAKGFVPRTFDSRTVEGVGPLYPYSPGLYGSGNNVAFATAALRDLGGYDEALGPGTRCESGEELDLFLSLILGGRRIAYEPSAIVWHRHRATTEDLTAQLHGYGVGLAALMTKWALRSRADATHIASRLPAGARAALRQGPSGIGSVLPAPLRTAERRGMMIGPVAYAASRRRARAARW